MGNDEIWSYFMDLNLHSLYSVSLYLYIERKQTWNCIQIPNCLVFVVGMILNNRYTGTDRNKKIAM